MAININLKKLSKYNLIENLGLNNKSNLEKYRLPKINLNLSLYYDINLDHHLHNKLTQFQSYDKKLKKTKNKKLF